ncbi:hypothetical protein NE865_16313 [Phthorimaea operculella]|nr:hypothetical protein NE865_16313 [Phthorimaea operculella]
MSAKLNCIACNGKIDRGYLLNCSKCKDRYHYTCLEITSAKFREHQDEVKRTVKCPKCTEPAAESSKDGGKGKKTPKSVTPAADKKITPKATPSTGAPPKSAGLKNVEIIVPEINLVQQDSDGFVTEKRLRDILRQEVSQIISHQVTEKLRHITEQMTSYQETFEFFNSQYEDLKKSLEEKDVIIKQLQLDNEVLQGSVREMSSRLGSVEQIMRETNIEINGIPEHRSENLAATVIRLADSVGCPLADADIQHVTRVAKLNKDSDRPRAVIAKLRNTRQRDSLLAAVSKFNKNKKNQDKLNSAHLDIKNLGTLEITLSSIFFAIDATLYMTNV